MSRDRLPERTSIIPGMLGNPVYSPRAAQLQRSTDTTDGTLTELARNRHPTVAWWWGVRKVDGITSAVCYICDEPIVQGALNVDITEAQRDEVDAHRRVHWQDVMQAIGKDAGF